MLCPFNKFEICKEEDCPFYYKNRIDKTDQCHRTEELIERREIYRIIKKSLPGRR